MTRRPEPGPAWLPTVSLVVPCRNEERTVCGVLRSLLAQDYPAELTEVVFVDGMSTDRTRAAIDWAARAAARPPYGPRIRVIDNPERITPVALNLGVAAACGEVVFTLGAHTSYPPNYVSGALATMARYSADAVGSCALTLPGADTPVARAIARALASPFGVGGSRMRTGVAGPVPADTASCPGYRRRVFQRIGGFNPALVRNQDIEFNLRLRHAGMRLMLDPAITSQYRARATIGRLWRNSFENGWWVVRSLRFSPFGFRPRHLAPLAALLGALAGLALAAGGRPLPLAAACSLYLALNLAFAMRGRNPLLLAVFPLMHFAYGCGSLQALLTFSRPQAPRPGLSVPGPLRHES